jgi:hypothetical protein
MTKKNKRIIIWCVIALLIIGNVFQFAWNHSRLFGDAVPDEETAIIIAKAVLDEDFSEPLFLSGGENVYRTFDVTFNRFRRAWVVSANFPAPPEGYVLFHGWVPEVTIRMRDARIISIRFR